MFDPRHGYYEVRFGGTAKVLQSYFAVDFIVIWLCNFNIQMNNLSYLHWCTVSRQFSKAHDVTKENSDLFKRFRCNGQTLFEIFCYRPISKVMRITTSGRYLKIYHYYQRTLIILFLFLYVLGIVKHRREHWYGTSRVTHRFIVRVRCAMDGSFKECETNYKRNTRKCLCGIALY